MSIRLGRGISSLLGIRSTPWVAGCVTVSIALRCGQRARFDVRRRGASAPSRRLLERERVTDRFSLEALSVATSRRFMARGSRVVSDARFRKS